MRKSLRRQGLGAVYKRPYRLTTDSNHQTPIAQNVLDRRFDGWQANQAWVADIAYITTGEGWLYRACVLDLASRRIVDWIDGFYNRDRMHTSIGYQAPVAAELGRLAV